MMEAFFSEIYNFIITFINTSMYGPFLACILILLESILPALPLFVFITILFISFGPLSGFILSYILTCLGCLLSYFLCRKFAKSIFERKIRKYEKANRLMQVVDKISLGNLVLLVAIPFTPAFLINVVAGISKMQFKKYFISILIGKISLVAFWGFIGTSLLESLKNPKILLLILFMLGISYILSYFVAKKLKVE